MRVGLTQAAAKAERPVEAMTAEREAMIPARIALHEDGLRHMAFDATVPHTLRRMVTVQHRIDPWRVQLSGSMTTLAKSVVLNWKECPKGVRMVAIHAGHPGMSHATQSQ